MSKTYLLEIGVEELPARFIDDGKRQLCDNFTNLLKEERIQYEIVETFSTPRRLTIVAKGLGEFGGSEENIVKGPAKRIALDDSGNPTKALVGFMKGQNITREDIIIQEYKGEEYVYGKVLRQGKKLEDVLSSKMADVIKNINFPKSMKWGGKNLKFARPIRWIVSVLDNSILPFQLEGIVASNITKGHRFLGSQSIVIDNIDGYKDILKENFVIVDEKERKDIIKYSSEKLAREKGGSVEKDDDLLNEVTNLVEYPTPIIGRIKDEYLVLPFDVVTTPMKEHLRYFPVLDDKGRLLPYFITVRNGDDNHVDTVVKGNEKVLGARLEDAKFFYKEYIMHSLD